MSKDATPLLIGTKNKGKIKELKKFLAGLPLEINSLDEFENIVEPEETGATFAENAELKAGYYALETGMSALADDSGLEVEALGGAPGVFSARYAGENSTDADKIAKLLDELKKKVDRRANFVCSMAVSDNSGKIIYRANGICEGKIALNARGTNGFGYDPVFIPDGFEKTFGELPDEIKREISHRKRAIEQVIRFFGSFDGVLT
jgi:XTP/dITP diphosphohydrolase